MTKDIEEIQKKSLPILKKAGVVRSSIFGSAARGDDFTASSDIDFLIKFQEGKSLFDLVRLKRDLEKVLERSVDVVNYSSLKPRLRKYIDQDKIDIL